MLACPICHGSLRENGETLSCNEGHSYSISDGIPDLVPGDEPLTIDEEALRIKTEEEAADTVRQRNLIDTGIMLRHRTYYLAYFALIISLAAWKLPLAGLIAILFLLDWIVFRSRRGNALARDEAQRLRLRTIRDHTAVDRLYERENKQQPTMSEWVALARDTSLSSIDAEEETDQTDDERYLDIRRIYDDRPLPPQVIVDVGANDGVATRTFGIGAGRTVIGVDVSRQLLEQFAKNLPDQFPVVADGGRLPLRDNTVDFLFCTETLEHIADPDAAVADFLRVLKPGGCMVIQSPNAHRLRNLNPFHIAMLKLSVSTDRFLQKKMVHENTWHNGLTYHWDFSLQDYRRMASGARILELRSRDFFVPRFLIRGRRDPFVRKEHVLSRVPLFRFFGGDLVLVAEKPPVQPPTTS